jgi:hypothetical protein
MLRLTGFDNAGQAACQIHRRSGVFDAFNTQGTQKANHAAAAEFIDHNQGLGFVD